MVGKIAVSRDIPQDAGPDDGMAGRRERPFDIAGAGWKVFALSVRRGLLRFVLGSLGRFCLAGVVKGT